MAKGTIKPARARMDEAAAAAISGALTVARDMGGEGRSGAAKSRDGGTQAVNFSMSKPMYEELKKVFGGAGYSFAQGCRMAFDYILSEISEGNLEVRESGFRKTLSARVGRF